MKLCEQQWQRRGNIANDSQTEVCPSAKVFRQDIHLDNLCILGLGEKLPVRKVRSKHEQEIAFAHGMITG